MKKISLPNEYGVCSSVSEVADDFVLDPGWYELPANAKPNEFYVANGVLHAYPQQVKDDMMASPGPTYVWDTATLSWIDRRTLADFKRIKITEIKTEAITRMSAILPDLDSFGAVVTLKELWLSIAPAARQPTTKMTQVINIYQAAATGIADVKAAANKAAVDAVTVAWPT